MTHYLISFNDGAMDHIPAEGWPAVGEASHAVVRGAIEKSDVWVYGGGLQRQRASIVATDGMVTDSPCPETKEVVGGFAVVDVATRREAPGMGREDRRGVPLRARGQGADGGARNRRDAPPGRRSGLNPTTSGIGPGAQPGPQAWWDHPDRQTHPTDWLIGGPIGSRAGRGRVGRFGCAVRAARFWYGNHRGRRPRQALRRPHRGERGQLRRRAGRDLRHPGAQRGRQEPRPSSASRGCAPRTAGPSGSVASTRDVASESAPSPSPRPRRRCASDRRRCSGTRHRRAASHARYGRRRPRPPPRRPLSRGVTTDVTGLPGCAS